MRSSYAPVFWPAVCPFPVRPLGLTQAQHLLEIYRLQNFIKKRKEKTRKLKDGRVSAHKADFFSSCHFCFCCIIGLIKKRMPATMTGK